MTTAAISGGKAPVATQAQQTTARGPQQAARAADPQDVRAMADAFAAARKKGGEGLRERSTGLLREGVVQQAPKRGADGKLEAMAGEARVTGREEQADQQHGSGALPGMPGGMPAPIQIPQAPPPHIDPTAFATLIGQMWAREQAKGTREVRVQFGEKAWPATGARLVRAADGSLDIALLVGNRGTDVDGALPGLRERLGERGISVGALAVERDG